jgi:hypothetical protein
MNLSLSRVDFNFINSESHSYCRGNQLRWSGAQLNAKLHEQKQRDTVSVSDGLNCIFGELEALQRIAIGGRCESRRFSTARASDI